MGYVFESDFYHILSTKRKQKPVHALISPKYFEKPHLKLKKSYFTLRLVSNLV